MFTKDSNEPLREDNHLSNDKLLDSNENISKDQNETSNQSGFRNNVKKSMSKVFNN